MPIRVLHIVGIMNMGGIENFLMNIYRNIDRNKIQFDFLVTRNEDGIFDKEIIELGGRIHKIEALENKGFFSHKMQINDFFKFHKEYKIVHCHRDALCSMYLKIAKKNGIPIRIAHSHTTQLVEKNTLKGKIKIGIKNYNKAFVKRHATDLMACGEKAGEWLFGKGSSFTIINNGIPIKNYMYCAKESNNIREILGIKPEEFVIGHIGSFTLPKNHDFILEIFKNTKKNFGKSKLLLIGNGVEQERIKIKVNDLGLDKDVIFLGIRRDVNKILMGMDVFVFPSLFEGLPVSLIEAQATGVPCLISSNITQEVNLKVSYLKFLSINNVDIWVNEIRKIYDKDEKKLISRNIEKDRVKHYDIEEACKQLEGIYLNKTRRQN